MTGKLVRQRVIKKRKWLIHGGVMLGLAGALSGCAMAPSKLAEPVAAPVISQSVTLARERVLAQRYPESSTSDDLVLALFQLNQDMGLAETERSEMLKSLAWQPLPHEPLDNLRQAELLLLQHQGAATQSALTLLKYWSSSPLDEKAKPLAPLAYWLLQQAKGQSDGESKLEQLNRQNQELQGRSDNLAHQIQELRAIEHHLSSRPAAQTGAVGGDKP